MFFSIYSKRTTSDIQSKKKRSRKKKRENYYLKPTTMEIVAQTMSGGFSVLFTLSYYTQCTKSKAKGISFFYKKCFHDNLYWHLILRCCISFSIIFFCYFFVFGCGFSVFIYFNINVSFFIFCCCFIFRLFIVEFCVCVTNYRADSMETFLKITFLSSYFHISLLLKVSALFVVHVERCQWQNDDSKFKI